MEESTEKKEAEPERRKDQIYIGQLGQYVKEKDLRREFEKFGEIKDLIFKSGFAFIVTSFKTLDLQQRRRSH